MSGADNNNDDKADEHVDEAAVTLSRAVRQRLAELGNPTDALAMQRYMKSAMPLRGVKMKVTRSTVSQMATAHRLPDKRSWRQAVLSLWDEAAYREERYAAIELADHRLFRSFQTVDQLPLYQHLIISGAWWDLVDPISSRLIGSILRAHHPAGTLRMRTWACSEDLWLRRAAIICQLQTKELTDLSLLAFALSNNLEDSLHGREFFIRKGVGWALRQHARIDPGWVVDFIAQNATNLSDLSRREALKHIRSP